MLQSSIDGVYRDRIFGWARESTEQHFPLALLILIDDLPVIRIIADRPRGDLTAIGFGHCAFELALAPPLSPLVAHVVRIVIEETGVECPGSPRIIPAMITFDATIRAYWATAMTDYGDDHDELLKRLTFINDQAAIMKIRSREMLSAQHGRLADLRVRSGWAAHAELRDSTHAGLRILVIDETMPRIAHDAGSNAILSHCRAFASLGHHVVLAPADTRSGPEDDAITASGLSLACAPLCNSIEELLRMDDNQYDIVYLYRASTATRYLQMARHYMPSAKIIYSVADLHHLRLLRQIKAEVRQDLGSFANRMRHNEFLAAASADLTVTHSPVEAAIIGAAVPAARVAVIPWGISGAPGPADFTERHGIAFVGTFAHGPNIAAAAWLIDDIMPRVNSALPALECALIGSEMPNFLREVRPGIRAVGAVPDLAAALARIRITVAPLTYGAGIKGKVLHSLALGIPCVCTPIAAEGLEFGPALQTLVAFGTDGIADAMLRVYTDPQLFAACRREGLDLVARSWGQRLTERLLDNALQSIAGGRS